MENYTCEEDSKCTRFQAAICLHCNRRLCVVHISEHDTILASNITNLSLEVKGTFQQINEESEKRKNTFNTILTSLNQWRAQQIEKIQQIYENHLNLIESQHKVLTDAEVELFKQLEQNALQPLEHVQRQQNANMEMINHIQQTIEKVRKDNAYLKWNLAISPTPVDMKYSSLNPPAISVPNQSSKSDNQENATSTKVEKQSNGHPLKELVAMFSNISNIEQAKYDIDVYVKNRKKKFKLPNFICSYLTAWHRKSRIDEQVFLLNEYITTVQKYLRHGEANLSVLLGMQAFFYSEDVKENKNEMMTFLLQFFLNHHCIDQEQILKWYNHRGTFSYEGFSQAKQLARQFIESLSTNQPVIDQSYTIEIKQEPVPMIE